MSETAAVYNGVYIIKILIFIDSNESVHHKNGVGIFFMYTYMINIVYRKSFPTTDSCNMTQLHSEYTKLWILNSDLFFKGIFSPNPTRNFNGSDSYFLHAKGSFSMDKNVWSYRSLEENLYTEFHRRTCNASNLPAGVER